MTDHQLKGWRVAYPDKPNDFGRSVPVKLDGKGNAVTLRKPALNEGSLSKTRAERIAEAQAAMNQAQARSKQRMRPSKMPLRIRRRPLPLT